MPAIAWGIFRSNSYSSPGLYCFSDLEFFLVPFKNPLGTLGYPGLPYGFVWLLMVQLGSLGFSRISHGFLGFPLVPLSYFRFLGVL